MALASHFLFLPQFAGLDSAAFVYVGGDSATQLIPATSFLERNLLEGNLGWSWEYGLGGDLFSQFSYYYTTSPFFYLQFAIKWLFGAAGGDFALTQAWRLAFSMMKQTLCMLFMFALLRQEKKSRLFSACGALLYGCSFWFIDNSLAFDFMTDAMLWPPLVVMGYNRYRRTGKWLPLLVAVALSMANSFYFGYINCLFYLAFALIFSFDGSQEGLRQTLKEYSARLGRLALIVLGALLVASAAFIPSVLAFLGADRSQAAAAFDLLPSFDFVKALPEILFFKGGQFAASDVQTYAFPLAILLVPFIKFKDASRDTRRKTVLAVLLLASWCVPAVSSVMNGLSYPSNRWCYLVVFAIAYAFPNWMETLVEQRRIRPAAIAVVAALAAVFAATHNLRTADLSGAPGYSFPNLGGSDMLFLVLGIAFVALLALLQTRRDERGRRGVSAIALAAFMGAVVLAMPYGPYAWASGFRDNANIEQFSSPDQLNELQEGTADTRAAYEELAPAPSEFYRIADGQAFVTGELAGHELRVENRSWLLGGYSTTCYNSLIEKSLNQWLKQDYGVTSTTMSASQYRGFGHRLFLENAWGVRYQLNVGDAANLYGYAESPSLGNGVWENTNALGLDIWYDASTPLDVWNGWTYAQRDAALLQTAVVEDGAALPEGVGESGIEVTDTVAEIPLSSSDLTLEGAALEDGGNALVVADGSGRVSIEAPPQESAGEYLLTFTLVKQDGTSFLMSANGEEYWTGAKGYRWGYPSNTYSLCFPNVSAGSPSSLDVYVSEGAYTVSEVKLEFNSYEDLSAWTAHANRYSLEDLLVESNRIAGVVENGEPGVLALSLPYDSGWSCLVDGKPVETLKVNGAFTGIPLDAGSHTVELRYASREAALGAAVSLAGCALVASALIMRRLRHRKPAR